MVLSWDDARELTKQKIRTEKANVFTDTKRDFLIKTNNNHIPPIFEHPKSAPEERTESK
jgi:hypothetical protein